MRLRARAIKPERFRARPPPETPLGERLSRAPVGQSTRRYRIFRRSRFEPFVIGDVRIRRFEDAVLCASAWFLRSRPRPFPKAIFLDDSIRSGTDLLTFFFFVFFPGALFFIGPIGRTVIIIIRVCAWFFFYHTLNTIYLAGRHFLSRKLRETFYCRAFSIRIIIVICDFYEYYKKKLHDESVFDVFVHFFFFTAKLSVRRRCLAERLRRLSYRSRVFSSRSEPPIAFLTFNINVLINITYNL